MKRHTALAFIQAAFVMSRVTGQSGNDAPHNNIPYGIQIAAGANGEYHPRKHTKMSYRDQQRAAKKRKK
jgi:hypothetical protein